jgi:cyclase
MNGYDDALISLFREKTNYPMTVLGGAGKLDDIKLLISKYKIIGAAAGSLFVFKGKYKAVLINYPNREEKSRLFS